MFITSHQFAEFSCAHIKLVSNSMKVRGTFSLTAKETASYPSDSKTKELLKTLVVPVGHHAACEVTDRSYVLHGPFTTTNMFGRFFPREGAIRNCCQLPQVYMMGKQEISRSLCVHLHILFCCLDFSNRPSPSPSSNSSLSTQKSAPPSSSISTRSNTHYPEYTSSKSRISTLNLYTHQKLTYTFPPVQLKSMNTNDASTFLGSAHGWKHQLQTLRQSLGWSEASSWCKGWQCALQ